MFIDLLKIAEFSFIFNCINHLTIVFVRTATLCFTEVTLI
jgi:hypothetical protein